MIIEFFDFILTTNQYVAWFVIVGFFAIFLPLCTLINGVMLLLHIRYKPKTIRVGEADLKLATPPSRSIAFVLDFVIWIILYFLIVVVYTMLRFYAYSYPPLKETLIVGIIGLPCILILYLYWVLPTYLWGVTLGKLALGLKVVCPNDKLSFKKVAIRELIGLTISPLMLCGPICMYITKNLQAPHDMATDTIVVMR